MLRLTHLTPAPPPCGALCGVCDALLRCSQLGLMAFCSEAKIPGAVPFLKGVIKPYSGEFMAPLTENAFVLNGHSLVG